MIIIVLISISVSNKLIAQARLVLNGGTINMSQGAQLVIANSASNAITRTSGYITSDGANNIIRWNIGTTTGTYVIPWGYSGTYIPVSFSLSGAAGAAGYFQFSTYHTNWDNSSTLPGGVSHFNRSSGRDNSKYALDRFWRIEPVGYTAKPTLSNLILTYVDVEHSVAQNTISETGIRTQRWNPTSTTWIDLDPASTINTTNNQVTVTSVTPANNFAWWTLTYLGERHWLPTTTSNWNNTANWSVNIAGTSGAATPVAIDEVFFDDPRDGNITIDAAVNVSSLAVASGYSGTITQGAQSITVSGTTSLAGGTFVGGSALIQSGGNFTLAGTAFTSTTDRLDVKGNFSLTSGSFTHNNGTVEFSGATPQTLTSVTPITFNNMRVTNTATPGLSIESDQNLRGILTLTSNVLVDVDGSSNTSIFTLLSTADDPVQDGAIAALPTGASVSGSMTVQRFMTKEGGNDTRIYRYISSPVQNATVADIQNEIPITGSFTGYSVCSTCLRNQSMFAYDESVVNDINGSGVADFNDGYIDFPNASNTETLQPARGYALFVRGNILPSTRWDVRGNVNQGNVTAISFPVTYTSSGVAANDGWNLVGNPYPSTIDWNAASGWTKTNLEGSIYIHDNGSIPGRFATWNGTVGTNGGSRYIAMSQGFWVKANGVGVPALQGNENIKQPGASTSFFREGSMSDLLRITLSNATANDEAVIHFREDATPQFDAHADAWKLRNEKVNLSSLGAGGELFAINSRSSLICYDSVNLSIEDTSPGNYQLSFTNVNSFDDILIHLTDRLTNKTISFDNDTTYNFAVSIDPATFGSERFHLWMSRTPLLTILEADGILSIPFEKHIQWYFNGELIEGATSSSHTPDASGTYEAVVQYHGCTITGSIDFIITGAEEATIAGINIFPNPSSGEFFIRMNTKPESVILLDPLGRFISTVSVVHEDDQYSGSIDLGDRTSGVYILVIREGDRTHQIKLVRK